MSEESKTSEKKAKSILKSLFTDKEWDADATKIIGFGVVIAGLVGFFMGKDSFQWVIGFGAGLIGTGKFSNEG